MRPSRAFPCGLCAFPVDAPRSGAAAALSETTEKTRATVRFPTPLDCKLMFEHAAECDLSSLRVCGGEPLVPAVFNRWKETTGVPMINGPGISELPHIFISAAGGDIRPGEIGRLVVKRGERPSAYGRFGRPGCRARTA